MVFEIFDFKNAISLKISCRFWHIQCRKMSWPWNLGLRSLKFSKIIPFDPAPRNHDFLLMFHSNHRPSSHRFRDKRRFPSKIANFSHPMYLYPSLNGFPLNWISAQWSENTTVEWWGYQMVWEVIQRGTYDVISSYIGNICSSNSLSHAGCGHEGRKNRHDLLPASVGQNNDNLSLIMCLFCVRFMLFTRATFV